jgi:hypothetical protein
MPLRQVGAARAGAHRRTHHPTGDPRGSTGMSQKTSTTLALGSLPVMAAAFLAGCGDSQNAYCVKPDNTVVGNQYCDSSYRGGGGYFWYFPNTSHSYGAGQRIYESGDRLSSTDKAGLAKRGGFGSKSSSSGVGRSMAHSSSSFHSGGS